MISSSVGGLRGSARRLARRVRSHLAPGALLLLYHRIAEAASHPLGSCVTPAHFAEQMEVLRRCACPMPLGEMAAALREGRPLPRRAVAVTFDDGYAGDLRHARTALERFDIPATVFLISGAIGRVGEFWWDELARLLLAPRSLPRTLHLAFGVERRRWSLGKATYSAEEARRHRSWRFTGAPPPTARHAAYYEIWHLLHGLPEPERDEIMGEIRAWSRAPAEDRAENLPLTEDEVRALAVGGLIELGAHTATHPPLSAHTAEVQRQEIQAGKARIEAVLGRPVASFSYPYGRYTPLTVELVRDAGFAYACSTAGRAIRSGADPLTLSRVGVQDGDGETFGRWLAGAFA